MTVQRLLYWIYRRWRPAEGWLALLLLAAMLGTLTATVGAADWVPETNRLLWLTPLSLALTWLLARRVDSVWRSWLWLTLYGLVLNVMALAQAPLPWQLLLGDGAAPLIRRNLLLYLIRWLSWLDAVIAGEMSTETLPFATLLGLALWFLGAWVVWGVLRRRRPLQAFTPAAFAVALNSFFAGLPVWYVVGFLAVGMLLAALLNYVSLARSWDARGIDYAEDIRVDVLVSAGVLALVLLVPAVFLPAIPVTDLARRVLRSDAVQAAESELARSFAGVREPETGVDLRDSVGGLGSGGLLPRSFLIGDPPELAADEVFRGSVAGGPPAGWHWRGLSLDVYTGDGWRLSAVETIPLAPNQRLTADLEPAVPVTATVRWTRESQPATRYYIGVPLRFSEPVTLTLRSGDDLVRAAGTAREYSSSGLVAVPAPDQLRGVDMTAAPAPLLARYTALPDDVPQRVVDLAAEVAGGRPTPYDQVLALQRFLHQYPYSLADAEPVPAGADAVDFFLFESRIGYCDYYASAMVVMARSLGIPARYAIGYVARPPDALGEQVITARDAHSWAEIYFPGFGWIEFEPTPPFAQRETGGSSGQPFDFPTAEGPIGAVPPIPATDQPAGSRPWWPILPAAALLGLLLLAAWRRRQPALDPDSAAYGRLQRWGARLGRPPRPSETPREYAGALLDVAGRRVGDQPSPAWRHRLAQLAADVDVIVERYGRRQYGMDVPPDEAGSAAARRRLAGTLRRLWWRGGRPRRS